MKLSRRDILKRLLAAPLAATVDLEKLLWVPRPQIVVPGLVVPSIEEINAVTCARVLPGIADNFFKSAPFLEYLKTAYMETTLGPLGPVAGVYMGRSIGLET